MMPSVYLSLIEVASKGRKFSPLTPNETDEDHLRRLTQAVSDSTKDDFDAMSTEAQGWFDAAAYALNEGGSVPLPEGYDRDALIAAANTPRAATMARPSAAPAATPTPASPTPAATPARRGRPVASGNASTATSTHIRRAVIADENATVDMIIEKLQGDNLDVSNRRSTVSTIRYDTISTLKLAREMGWHPPQ